MPHSIPRGWPKNFDPNRDKFKSRDGVKWSREIEENARILAWQLQAVRDEIGKPLIVTNAYRSPALNRKVGSKPTSWHPTGKAADVYAPGIPTRELHAVFLRLIKDRAIFQGGLGLYVKSRFVHYDWRLTRARWRGN